MHYSGLHNIIWGVSSYCASVEHLGVFAVLVNPTAVLCCCVAADTTTAIEGHGANVVENAAAQGCCITADAGTSTADAVTSHGQSAGIIIDTAAIYRPVI